MPTQLSVIPNEESTLVITASYYDEDDNAITPKTAYWTLTDKNAVVINSRKDVAISGLATSNNIVLSGDDLAVNAITGTERVFLIKITYDSNYGNDLPLNDIVTFNIKDFINIT